MAIMADARLFRPFKPVSAQATARTIVETPVIASGSSGFVDSSPSVIRPSHSPNPPTPGTLLITKKVAISPPAHGMSRDAIGIWSSDQVERWRVITQKVHARNCFIFCQLSGLVQDSLPQPSGRSAFLSTRSATCSSDGSNTTQTSRNTEEAQDVTRSFVHAARNAIQAGFDGVQIHGVKGDALDQFIRSSANVAAQSTGESNSPNSDVGYQTFIAVVNAIGWQRVGLRLELSDVSQAAHPPQYTDVLVRARLLNLAYLQIVGSDTHPNEHSSLGEFFDFAYQLVQQPSRSSSDAIYTRTNQSRANPGSSERDMAIVLGRHFAHSSQLTRGPMNLRIADDDLASLRSSHSPEGYFDPNFAGRSYRYRSKQPMTDAQSTDPACSSSSGSQNLPDSSSDSTMRS